MSKRLEEIKEHFAHCMDEGLLFAEQEEKLLENLYEKAERVEELENRNKELEYASKFNGELNEFLQKRKLPPSTLGRHVVNVVMNYVEELEETNKKNYWIASDFKFENLKLEQQNKRYREVFKKLSHIYRKVEEREVATLNYKEGYLDGLERAINFLKALESESE